MTLYLRDDQNRDVADIEITEDDVHVVVPILGYSLLLLQQNDLEAQAQCIADFQTIQGLRGWYWETFREKFPNPAQDLTVASLKGGLANIVARYNLAVVED